MFTPATYEFSLWIYFVVLIALLLVIMVFCFSELALAVQYIRARRRNFVESPGRSTDQYPMVTIQLPVYNEKYVAERIIRSAAAIHYPKDKLQIQVLDDSTDETAALTRALVEELQAEGCNIQWLHRTDRSGFKAGALRDAMHAATGEYIAIFDADFIVPSHFLRDTLPYFSNPEIGMVQTRWGHLNEPYSLLTRIQGFFIDMHFTVQHTGRNSAGYFINFNGTAGIWRKSCIEDAGGWTPDTLTEDLDLSYRAQLKGWQFKYHEGSISPSELPAHISGIKSQQFRWVKGGAQVAKKLLMPLMRSDASYGQKWFGLMHIFAGSTYLVSFFLFLMSVPLVYFLKCTFLARFIPHLSLFFLSTIAIFIVGGISFFHVGHEMKHKKMTFTMRFVLFLAFSMGLSLNNSIAIVEGFSGRKSAFIRTPKFNLSATAGPGNWSSFAYISRGIPPQVFLEILLLLYFAVGIGLAVHYQFYGLLMLHIMLVTGYGIIVFYSLKHNVFQRG